MNNSLCSIHQKQISNILSEEHSEIKEYIIRNSFDENLVVNCNGLFYFEVIKWKNVKTNYNYVSVPFLKLGDKYFINLKSNSDYPKSQEDFNEFKEEAINMGFSLDALNRIEIKYKKGVEIFPKGRLW
uniref:hypothetical protein n=1 Tax=Flavobacterium sp. TaxID=239 RepID=UPI00404A8ED5